MREIPTKLHLEHNLEREEYKQKCGKKKREHVLTCGPDASTCAPQAPARDGSARLTAHPPHSGKRTPGSSPGTHADRERTSRPSSHTPPPARQGPAHVAWRGPGLYLVSPRDHFEYAQLAPCLPHVPLFLGTHVWARPNNSPRFVQVSSFHSS